MSQDEITEVSAAIYQSQERKIAALTAERDAANQRIDNLRNRVCNITESLEHGVERITAELERARGELKDARWANSQLTLSRIKDAEYQSLLRDKLAASEALLAPAVNGKATAEHRLAEACKERDALREQVARLEAVEQNGWCVVPPNQETHCWTICKNFDGEFGYQDEIGSGATLREAIDAALAEASPTRPVSREDPQ